MAIDNLNFYSNWLPAGQLTDKYSTQPWCLKSKNLDIFSSSKSVKATAWSTPTTTDSDVIKQDWKLLLKTDWKVYERTANWDVLVVDPSVNFPVYAVSYNWRRGTYTDATWGTPQDLVAKYEWDELKSFVVFTDRASYNWSSVKYVPKKEFWTTSNLTYQWYPMDDGYYFKQTSASGTASIYINVDAPFSKIPLHIKAVDYIWDDTTISLASVAYWKYQYYYDAQLDWMTPRLNSYTSVSFSWSITDGIDLEIPVMPRTSWGATIRLNFVFIKKEWASTYWWQNGELYIGINWWPTEDYYVKIGDTESDWDYNEYYTYLPIRDRSLVSVWDYGYAQSYWVKGTSFQPLYKWTWSWINVNWEKKTIYDFVSDMGWETDVSMDIIGMIIWNEQVYMIWNMDWNWYIIPCDLTWWKGTPYIWYGCTFRWVANIDYLMYLVWEDRWVSQLWVYNGQELVAILGWTEEKDTVNLIDYTEQYRFDWKMVEYRGDLVLSTSDNRIFGYWQTFGGKGWAFIHELPWTITDLKTDWNDLVVGYSVTASWTTTKYLTAFQDDTPIKNYNTEWVAEYPIVIWNHLLEKEETDLYCSYILPSSTTSLEFWGNANHYTFWTFKTDGQTTPDEWSVWYIDWATNWLLKFVEKNWVYLTFRLVWQLPVMSSNGTSKIRKLDVQHPQNIDFTEINHFRKIWEITTDKYVEWEFRFTNLNTKLDLPRSHSLQIMVKGKGTANHTPELFAVDLVANQRERW